jgi:hypothetical protein
MQTHTAMSIACYSTRIYSTQTCFLAVSALLNIPRHPSPFPVTHRRSTALYICCHSKTRIVIAYMYGIMIIERSMLLDPAPMARQILSHDRALSILLLVLLRRLSGLVLELLDRLLRVVLVAAVGLDLCHKIALAKRTPSFRPCVRAHGNHTPDRWVQTYRALAIASKTLVPFSLAVLLLLQLLLLELLGLFGCARVYAGVEVSTGSNSCSRVVCNLPKETGKV